jgi:hypothetical protein
MLSVQTRALWIPAFAGMTVVVVVVVVVVVINVAVSARTRGWTREQRQPV